MLKANPKITQSSKLSIGQEILIPSSVATVPQVQIPVVSAENGGSYVVKPGDNLSKIAKQNGVSLADLMNVNQLNSSSIIRPGQSLIIPESVGLNNITSVIDPYFVFLLELTTHIVKKGENLTRISSIYGASVKQIMEWNGLADAGRIRVGQTLIVSSSSLEGDLVPDSPATEPTTEPAPSTNDSLENFFKGNTDNRPVIVEPAENP